MHESHERFIDGHRDIVFLAKLHDGSLRNADSLIKSRIGNIVSQMLIENLKAASSMGIRI